MTDLTPDERYMLEQLAIKPIERIAPDHWEATGKLLEARGLITRTSSNLSVIRYEITQAGRNVIAK